MTHDGYDIRKWTANDMQRRPRRAWVRWALAGAIVTAFVLAAAQTSEQPDHVPTPSIVWIPMIAMLWSPFARDGWMTARGLASYDEFKRTALLRATARAYGAFLCLVGALLVWLWAASAMDWPRPLTARGWMAWGMALLAIGTTLPVAFAEFMVPMPDPEDDS